MYGAAQRTDSCVIVSFDTTVLPSAKICKGRRYFPGAQVEEGGLVEVPHLEPLTQKSDPRGSGRM
ncbi:hypothetical protein CSKR_105448 [Clonorchis sinensis]|uniref:Uncharacterized protein n=1 Tax=Clonorchis sinensis TaxID=79923 RepID=A0A3R7ESB7_CLOSI|nr:hypothetical protein CSKR_105448 [Clonorchis sinensis]